MVFSASGQYGVFVPTNYIWDIQQLQESDLPDNIKELLLRLYQNIGTMAMAINVKDTGVYYNTENINNQVYFPNPANSSGTPAVAALRQVYRLVINFGALPNAATKSVAHNIIVNAATIFTRIYATASDPVNFEYVPIPYASCTDVAHNIEINVDATNVNITTGSDRTNFTICYVVLEYLKF